MNDMHFCRCEIYFKTSSYVEGIIEFNSEMSSAYRNFVASVWIKFSKKNLILKISY